MTKQLTALFHALVNRVKARFSQIMSVGSEAGSISISWPRSFPKLFGRIFFFIYSFKRIALFTPSSVSKVTKTEHGCQSSSKSSSCFKASSILSFNSSSLSHFSVLIRTPLFLSKLMISWLWKAKVIQAILILCIFYLIFICKNLL